MISVVTKRPVARGDLIEHFIYLAENGSVEIAEQFLINAELSFKDLALQPMIGAPVILRNKKLLRLRKWRVRDFDHYLIFYLPNPGEISILRILHNAQNWWKLIELA